MYQGAPTAMQNDISIVKEDGMSYKEVAEILNISVLTVRNQVFIATAKFRAYSRPYTLNLLHRAGVPLPDLAIIKITEIFFECLWYFLFNLIVLLNRNI
jgi:DNA-binding CsgD family transcriptional regulator